MREVLPDEIKLLKAVCVDYGPNGLTVILYLAKYKDHKSTLRACFARRDTPEGWESFLEGLEKMEPAERISLDMLGIDLPFVVHRSNSYMTALDARQWLRRLVFQKAVSPSYFQECNSKCAEKYEETYGDKGLDEIDKGLWFMKERTRGPRKTKRIIY